MLQIGQKITGRVEKVVFQGKGLIRHQGLVIFVDDVLGDEEVVVEITQVKKSYCVAKLLEVAKASLHRRQPLCPYFGVCGGCQLQHAEYSAQLALKKQWVQDALLQIARPDVAIEKAEEEWGYRRKITLHYHFHNEKLVLGYYKKDNQTLLDIDECPIFSRGQFCFSSLKSYLKHLLTGVSSSGDVVLLKCYDTTGRMWYVVRLKAHQQIKKAFSESVKLPDNILKVIVEHGRRVEEFCNPLWPEKELFDTVFGLKIFISPNVFLQNYPEQSYKIYSDIARLISPGSKVLDLYCGIGILSLMLAKAHHSVIAIESSREAIALARRSLADNKLSHVRFIAGFVEDELRRALKGKNQAEEYTTWVINPPREGLSETMRKDIFEYLPKELLYVSCMPSTLARDLKELTKEHYEIVVTKAYDMFPETTHVETLVQLKKRA